MVSSQLHNATFSTVGLEKMLLGKAYNNIMWYYKTPKYSKLTKLQQYNPYVPRKSETERKTWEKIREKIPPPLDPVTISAGGLGQGCASLGAWWFPTNQAHFG